MPMGSPNSGFLAEVALQRLEAIVFQTFTPKLWRRYVDYTFVIIDTAKRPDFKMALNNALPGTKFTLDKEKCSNLHINPPPTDRYNRNLCLWEIHSFSCGVLFSELYPCIS